MTGKHKVIRRRQWTDSEPDTLSVSLEIDGSTGEPHVVFSGNATWLTPRQATEVAVFIEGCVACAVDRFPPVLGGTDGHH